MSLNKDALVASLKNAFLENLNQPDADAKAKDRAKQAVDQLANSFANAIEAYVKSGEVIFSAGSVTGATPANGMLQNGAASGGLIS